MHSAAPLTATSSAEEQSANPPMWPLRWPGNSPAASSPRALGAQRRRGDRESSYAAAESGSQPPPSAGYLHDTAPTRPHKPLPSRSLRGRPPARFPPSTDCVSAFHLRPGKALPTPYNPIVASLHRAHPPLAHWSMHAVRVGSREEESPQQADTPRRAVACS